MCASNARRDTFIKIACPSSSATSTRLVLAGETATRAMGLRVSKGRVNDEFRTRSNTDKRFPTGE